MSAGTKGWWGRRVPDPMWRKNCIGAFQLFVITQWFAVGGSRMRVVSISVLQRRNEHPNGIVDQVFWHCPDVQREDVVGLAACIVAAALLAWRLMCRSATVSCPKPIVEESGPAGMKISARDKTMLIPQCAEAARIESTHLWYALRLASSLEVYRAASAVRPIAVAISAM